MGKQITNTTWCGQCAVLLSVLFFFTPAHAATVTVHVGPASNTMSFSPDPVSIVQGDTVEWVWDSDFHSVTAGTPAQPTKEFDTGVVSPPFTFSYTFTEAGSFPYFCLLHEMMTGTVEVAAATTVSLSPKKDNTLYEAEDPTAQLSNGKGIYFYTGATGVNGVRRGLMAFDLSSIPANATITEATLSMFLSRSGPIPSADISVSKMSRDWGEGASDAGPSGGGMGVPALTGDASWIYNFYNTNLWTAHGGDFSSTLSATTTVSTENTTYAWSGSGLVADVQSWVSNPAANLGWVILGDETNAGSAKQFNTRENTDHRPQLSVTYTVPPTILGNIATRLRVETADNVLIGGFIITGTQPKRVIIRAIGPSLANFFPGVLANPILELHGPGGFTTITNDNWRTGGQEAEIIATGIPPSNDLESAIIATLPANNAGYTAIVRGVNNGTGIGVVEVYDLGRTTVDSQLGNIATRGLVQTGNNVLIGGLIVLGQDPLRVIVRAIGPSLPITGALANPSLELFDVNGTSIAFNDNWRTGGQEADIIATGIPPSNDLESAIIQNFTPGSYTAIVRGVNNTSGVGLVEAYALH